MKRILLFLVCLLIFGSIDNGLTLIVLNPSTYCAELKNPASTPQSPPKPDPLPIQQPTSEHPSKSDKGILIIIVQVTAAIVGGGLAGALVNIYFNRKQSKKELKSLILAFASEFTFAFVRCVKYYEQSKKQEISFSGLFDFTDASILSRFAVVNTQPEVVAAIMDLKSHYFQIRRHVEEAGRFAAQANRLAEDEKDREKLMRAAIHAQGTALAFFFSSYQDIERKTSVILEEAKKINPGVVVDDLEKKFKDALTKKSNLDKTNKEASKISPETLPNNRPKA